MKGIERENNIINDENFNDLSGFQGRCLQFLVPIVETVKYVLNNMSFIYGIKK